MPSLKLTFSYPKNGWLEYYGVTSFFFGGAILGSCHVSYAPMAGLPGGVQKTPRWLANPCTVDVWRHCWISCPRCVLSLTCDWTACFFQICTCEFAVLHRFLTCWESWHGITPQKTGGVSNRILPMDLDVSWFYTTHFLWWKAAENYQPTAKFAMFAPPCLGDECDI